MIDQEQFAYQHKGASYLTLLERMHDFLAPRSYFEIGTLTGKTLSLAKCKSICVDPCFQIQGNPTGDRPFTMLFQTTSDRFFADHDPSQLLGCEIDLAFLDGLHEAETLLRDFCNAEKHCKRNSVICMHDCIPMNCDMTCRANNGGLWTGDVWKVLPILKAYRPSLEIHSFDAGPTGLVCCTNLDPDDRSIERNLKAIWSEWRDVELSDYGFDKFIDQTAPRWTETVRTAEDMRRFFWL